MPLKGPTCIHEAYDNLSYVRIAPIIYTKHIDSTHNLSYAERLKSLSLDSTLSKEDKTDIWAI